MRAVYRGVASRSVNDAAPNLVGNNASGTIRGKARKYLVLQFVMGGGAGSEHRGQLHEIPDVFLQKFWNSSTRLQTQGSLGVSTLDQISEVDLEYLYRVEFVNGRSSS